MTITALSSIAKDVEQNQRADGGMLNRVISAIKTASAETGVNFSYLMQKAAQESGFRPDAAAKTSSATGLYQFTEQTWLRMVQEHGDQHGVGVLASKIETRPDGSVGVKDRLLRQQILDMRKNPEMAASMAAEFAQDNRAHLTAALGGTIGNTELYMAHFLGAGGATEFLQALRSAPTTAAANLLPQAAAANKSVFYDNNGKPRSVTEIYNRFATKMDGKGIELPEHLPDSINQPALLAQVSTALDAIPEWKLPAEASSLGLGFNGTAGALAANTNGLSGLAQDTSAASLFSVMLLAQMDALSHVTPTTERQNSERAEQTGTA
jgi:hypothetical protein